MPADILSPDPVSSRRLDEPPDQPPRSMRGRSVIDLATGDEDTGLGMEAGNPVIQIMRDAGEFRNAGLKLASRAAWVAPAIQQFLEALEMAIPQGLADLMAEQPPGMGQTGGGSVTQQAPTSPPISGGM